MEAKVRTEERFRFPCFEICNFLAAENLLKGWFAKTPLVQFIIFKRKILVTQC